jgi:cardiolipin synthase
VLEVEKKGIALKLPAALAHADTDLRYAANPKALRPANKVRSLPDGGTAFPAMLDAIRNAKEYVHMETYIYKSDTIGRRFGAALAARAQAGARVRLLIDAVGSLEIDEDFVRELQQAGVEVLRYKPFRPSTGSWGINRRDHRKILVVDGVVGFAGGLNIGDEYNSVEDGGGGWHDMHMRVEGPAVDDLARLFRKTWLAAGGATYPAVPNSEEAVATDGTAFAVAIGNEELKKRHVIRQQYLHAMKHAHETIDIMNAYFIPDRGIRRTLVNAVKRGVKVTVLVPGTSDLKAVQYASQSLYAALLKAGVRVFEWKGRMLHAKTAVVDAVWTTIGSYNLDARSLFHNLEVVMCVVDREFGAAMVKQIHSDDNKSQEIILSEWKRRPFWRKIAEWVCYQFRHWL